MVYAGGPKIGVKNMRTGTKAVLLTTTVVMVCAVLLPTHSTSAQRGTKLAKRIFIQATAMGQSTQLGRSVSVNLTIEEFSSPDDQQILLEAFSRDKNEGLVNALSKMKGKGRMAITGTLGYDINYIRKFSRPDGSTVYRMVTDRPLRFGEAWYDGRSTDYNLSAAEVVFSANGKKSGTIMPACKFKMDKNKQLEIELLQNPWKLVNIQRR
jgi:hypothetical protein